MTEPGTSFSTTKKRPNPWVILAIALIHIGIFYVLIRSLAPSAVASVEQTVVSAFTVTVTAPPEPQDPEPEGAQGDPGKEAVPKPTTAPEPKVRVREDRPAPRASSTGAADTSGATDQGQGTGRAGQGEGTGSGNGGGGQGGGIVVKPRLIRTITDASAFPVPPGGRQARIGKSVIVKLSVSASGAVSGCSVYRASPFPETDALVCRLAYDQVRFEPARDAAGNAVASTFYYQQRFFN